MSLSTLSVYFSLAVLWLWLNAIVPCNVLAAPLPHATIEIRVPVTTVDGTTISLLGGWHDQLKVGMILNLFNTEDKIIGQMRLVSVEPNSARGTLLTPGPADAVPLAPSYASTPYPLSITGVEGNIVTFLLPPGNRQLHPGDKLTVVRQGEPIATLQFQSYRPVSASLLQLKPGESVQPGDVAWAYNAELTFPTVTPGSNPPPIAPLTPNSPIPPTGVGTGGSSTGAVGTAPTLSNGSPAGTTLPPGTISPPATGSMTQTPNAVTTAPRLSAPHETDVFAVKEGGNLPRTRIATPVVRASAGTTLSRSGATGLIRMPSANVTADGQVRISSFSYNKSPDLKRLGNTTTYATSIGFLPHVEIGATVGNDRQGRDITANVKVQILPEASNRPAVAVGVAELKKTQGNAGKKGPATLYAAASKNILRNRLNVTAGVQHQSGTKIKPYGGVEVGLAKHVAAIIEHDSRDVNYGVRANLWRDRVQVGAQHLEGRWTSMVSLQVLLNNRHGSPPTVELPRPGLQLSSDQAVQSVQKRLISFGLENVTVRVLQLAASHQTGPVNPSSVGNVAGTSLEVSYENRSFPHNEVDALANVLATAAAYAPAPVDRLSIVIKRSAIPIMRVSTPLNDYLGFMDGHLNEKNFSSSFQALYKVDAEPVERVLADSSRGASSYGHADVLLRPGLTTSLATENYILGLGFNLQPELNLPITRGVGLDARGFIPVAGPLRGARTTYDRLALNYAAKLGSTLVSRIAAGQFPANRNGVLAEALLTPENSRLSLRTAVGFLKRTDNEGDQKATYLGEARYYLPGLDLTARLSGGRYLEGDKGVTAELLRRFGDTEVGFELRGTNSGRAGLVRLGIPLGPSYLSSRPSTLRLRPPDYFDYSQRSGITSGNNSNFVSVANAIGNELAVGGEASQSLLDRDKLNRPYLLHSLSDLRQIRPFDNVIETAPAPSVELSNH
ncbi:MAG: YjbH domain-containing protein [Abitibacteriaceae bacterium]|nr:YjbH domain-containing protein [Abditibacteriaceae bacterium]